MTTILHRDSSPKESTALDISLPIFDFLICNELKRSIEKNFFVAREVLLAKYLIVVGATFAFAERKICIITDVSPYAFLVQIVTTSISILDTKIQLNPA